MSRDEESPARRPRRRTARAAVALLALAAAAAVWPAAAQDGEPEAPPPAGFVIAVNGEFQLDGRQFRHVGVNTPGLVWERDLEVIADLDGMQRSGIKQVRALLANNYRSKEQVGNRLEWILARARERDIRVTLPFTDYYGGPIWAGGFNGIARHRVQGDDPYYTHCIYHCGQADEIRVLNWAWFDHGYKDDYLDFVKYIVGRFADHPAVFSWEVANELKSEFSLPQAKAFYRHVVTEIKTIDPHHMVAPGLISTHWLGITNDAERDAFYRDSGFDYLTIHSGGGIDEHNELVDVHVARRLGKPLVVEETGMNSRCSDRAGYFPFDFFDRMKQYYYQFYANNDKPASAMLLWSVEWGPHGSGDFCQGPAEQGRLADYERLWRDWSARLGGAPAPPETLRAAADCNAIFFNWEGGEGASDYFVDIAESFDDLVNHRGTFRNAYTGTWRNYYWSGLPANRTYFWRVYGRNGHAGTHGYPVPQTVRTCTNGTAMGVAYRAHVQNLDWGPWKQNWETAGTEGQSLRLEALQARLTNSPVTARLCYQVHLEILGDQDQPDWVCDVQEARKFMRRYAGTTGHALRVEAVRFRLEGAPGMDVEYEAHVQNRGWMGPVRSQAWAGTMGQSLRLEALRVRIVR